jgi:hypothetical protein
MPWIMGAAALGGAVISSNAAGDAADTQGAGTRMGIDEQRRQFDLTRADQAPYREGGSAAMRRLMEFMGLGGGRSVEDFARELRSSGKYTLGAPTAAQPTSGYGRLMDLIGQGSGTTPAPAAPRYDEAALMAEARRLQGAQERSPDYGSLEKPFTEQSFWEDPVTKLGYQFGLDEGTKALNRAAPLTTGRDSGAALKELTKFATDYSGSKAAESEGRFEGRKTNVFNRLMGLIGGGQTSNQISAAAGTNMANNVSGLITSGANARGAAGIAGANAWSGALGNVSNWWNQQNVLDRFMPKGGTPPANGAWQNNYAGGTW